MVLRKTMLDECKGDKFMEVLVVFTTAVLKKRLSTRKSRRKNLPVARQYAMATSLSLNQQASLLPLAIAHKAALTNVLRRRDDMRERYMDFGDLLDQKSHEAVERNEQCGNVLETIEQSEKDFPDATSIKRVLHDNWLGNPEWLEVLVQGDQAESGDALFQRQFEDIWTRVQLGQEVDEQATHHPSLLQDLEARVKDQEERLSRWQAFHAKIQESRSDEPAPKAARAKNSSVNFKFEAHQELRLGHTDGRRLDGGENAPVSDLSQSYGSILANMHDDLTAAAKVKSSRPPPKFAHKPKPSGIPMQPAAQRTAFASKPKAKPEPEAPPSPEPERPSQPSFQRPISPDWFSPLKKQPAPTDAPDYGRKELARSPSPAPTKSTFDDNHSIYEQYASDTDQDVFYPTHQSAQSVDGEPPSPMYTAPLSPSLPPSSPDPEDLLAEQILAGIDAASPSPVKKTQPSQQPSYYDEQSQPPTPSLTLMERTRLTMEGHTTSPAKPPPTPRSIPAADQAKADATAALIERTRQTMLAMGPPPPPLPAPKRTKSKTKKSGSLFPANPWEDKRKASPLFEEWADSVVAGEEEGMEGGGRATPKEELFEGGVDEMSVFKSRPKIAASPLMGPEGDDGVSELGDEGLDGGVEGEDEEDEDGYLGVESSPLKGKGR